MISLNCSWLKFTNTHWNSQLIQYPFLWTCALLIGHRLVSLTYCETLANIKYRAILNRIMRGLADQPGSQSSGGKVLKAGTPCIIDCWDRAALVGVKGCYTCKGMLTIADEKRALRQKCFAGHGCSNAEPRGLLQKNPKAYLWLGLDWHLYPPFLTVMQEWPSSAFGGSFESRRPHPLHHTLLYYSYWLSQQHNWHTCWFQRQIFFIFLFHIPLSSNKAKVLLKLIYLIGHSGITGV